MAENETPDIYTSEYDDEKGRHIKEYNDEKGYRVQEYTDENGRLTKEYYDEEQSRDVKEYTDEKGNLVKELEPNYDSHTENGDMYVKEYFKDGKLTKKDLFSPTEDYHGCGELRKSLEYEGEDLKRSKTFLDEDSFFESKFAKGKDGSLHTYEEVQRINGETTYTEFRDEGKSVDKVEKYDKDGILTSCGVYAKDGSGSVWEEYDREGKITTEKKFDQDGNSTGAKTINGVEEKKEDGYTVKNHFKDGNRTTKEFFEGDKLRGKVEYDGNNPKKLTEYDSNKDVSKVSKFTADKNGNFFISEKMTKLQDGGTTFQTFKDKEGTADTVEEYGKDGILAKRGVYSDQGSVWETYDKEGNVKTEKFDKDGKLIKEAAPKEEVKEVAPKEEVKEVAPKEEVKDPVSPPSIPKEIHGYDPAMDSKLNFTVGEKTPNVVDTLKAKVVAPPTIGGGNKDVNITVNGAENSPPKPPTIPKRDTYSMTEKDTMNINITVGGMIKKGR